MAQPTQSGTFVGGLMRGWKFGKRMQRREAQQERQQKQFESQQELRALQTEAQKFDLQNARAQQRRDEALRRLTAAEQAYEAGDEETAVQQFRDGLESLDMGVEDFSPEYARAVDKLSESLRNPGEADRGELVESANTVFRRRLNQGVGETVERDGKKVTITDKRIDEIAPAPKDDGQGNSVEPGIMARLQVTGETEDGEKVTWRAPLTANRSTADDDPAQSIPLEEITKQVVGRKQLMSGLARSPEFRSILRTARARAGGKVESQDVSYGTEEIKQGDQTVTYLTENGVPTKLLAEAPRWQQEQAQGESAGGPGGELKASDENAIYRQAAGLFGGVYNPVSGEIQGLDRNSALQVQAIAERASQLFLSREELTRSAATTQAARELGIDVENLGGNRDPRRNRDGSQGGGRSPGGGQSAGAGQGRRQGGDAPRAPSRNEGLMAEGVNEELGQRMQRFGQQAIDNGADPQRTQELLDLAIENINKGKDPQAVLRRYMDLVEEQMN